MNVQRFRHRFHPDGRYVVLEFWDEHNDPGIGYIDLENFDDGVVPIVDSMFAEESPELSPDGRLIVYVSNDGLHERIYLRRFDGTGDRILLESGGGHDPVW